MQQGISFKMGHLPQSLILNESSLSAGQRKTGKMHALQISVKIPLCLAEPV